uniref:Uncharacterized protein n=1 Tax=Arundo donax TaxID=35708 RepID=A0A0A9FQ51_ARUDO
MRARDTGP